LAAIDPLIIAPHSPDGQWWKKADTEFVLGLVTAARRRWPEVVTRSVIMGYSNGGIATWYFARLYPAYFSAAIPMAFNDTIVGASRLPIYAIQGAKDELFSITRVRDAVKAVKAGGSDVTLNERYRAGHMDACAYKAELALAGQWLTEHAFPKSAE
jgi:predicted esterase